jgi:hypothetical protein
MRSLLAILLVVLLNASSAYTEVPVFKLEVVCAGFKTDCSEALRVAKDAVRLLEAQLPLKFQIVAMRVERRNAFGFVGMQVDAWESYLHDLVIQDGAHLAVVLFGPDEPAPDSFFPGILGVSFLGNMGLYHAPKMLLSRMAINPTKVLAHELAHALGADHDKSGLMTAYINEEHSSYSLSKRSREQIKSHLRRVAAIRARFP